MDPAIKPVADRDWNVCGPAVTVKLEAVDHLMCIAALGVAQPGDVIVVAANGVTHTSVWGGGLTLSAKNLGAAGVVVDGAVLDSPMILERALAVLEECEAKSKILLATRQRMNGSKETFFSLRGGRSMVEKAGVEWVE